jgi:hypothetical protein
MKLNDLVYVKYNQALMDRFEQREDIDPISLKDIDDSNEWLTGVMEDAEEEIFGDDGLTWGLIASASGVGEAGRSLRSQDLHSRSRRSTTTGALQSKGKRPINIDEDVNSEDSEEENAYDDLESEEEDDVEIAAEEEDDED